MLGGFSVYRRFAMKYFAAVSLFVPELSGPSGHLCFAPGKGKDIRLFPAIHTYTKRGTNTDLVRMRWIPERPRKINESMHKVAYRPRRDLDHCSSDTLSMAIFSAWATYSLPLPGAFSLSTPDVPPKGTTLFQVYSQLSRQKINTTDWQSCLISSQPQFNDRNSETSHTIFRKATLIVSRQPWWNIYSLFVLRGLTGVPRAGQSATWVRDVSVCWVSLCTRHKSGNRSEEPTSGHFTAVTALSAVRDWRWAKWGPLGSWPGR